MLFVQELDMSYTQLGTEAAIVLAQVLSMDNSTLKRVCLSGNDIGEAGGWHLMCALTTSTDLEHLGVQGATFLPGKLLKWPKEHSRHITITYIL
jgi:Ran GTPase-activating protein (RanGAP) involved in mRNA processing and transport